MSNQDRALKILNSFVGFIAKTSGRDKICRIVQYATQFLSERAAQQGNAAAIESSRKWNRLSKEMRAVRKVLRFLRSMEYSRKITEGMGTIKTRRTATEKVQTAAAMLSALFTILFFVTDHRVFLAEIGVISKDNLPANFRKSFIYWGLQCIFSIIADVAELCVLKQRDSEEGHEDRHNELALDIIKNIFDSMIAYSTITKEGLNAKNIGLLGTVTSLIGVYQLWK